MSSEREAIAGRAADYAQVTALTPEMVVRGLRVMAADPQPKQTVQAWLMEAALHVERQEQALTAEHQARVQAEAAVVVLTEVIREAHGAPGESGFYILEDALANLPAAAAHD